MPGETRMEVKGEACLPFTDWETALPTNATDIAHAKAEELRKMPAVHFTVNELILLMNTNIYYVPHSIDELYAKMKANKYE